MKKKYILTIILLTFISNIYSQNNRNELIEKLNFKKDTIIFKVERKTVYKFGDVQSDKYVYGIIKAKEKFDKKNIFFFYNLDNSKIVFKTDSNVYFVKAEHDSLYTELNLRNNPLFVSSLTLQIEHNFINNLDLYFLMGQVSDIQKVTKLNSIAIEYCFDYKTKNPLITSFSLEDLIYKNKYIFDLNQSDKFQFIQDIDTSFIVGNNVFRSEYYIEIENSNFNLYKSIDTLIRHLSNKKALEINDPYSFFYTGYEEKNTVFNESKLNNLNIFNEKETLNIDSLNSKFIVIDFWFSHCAPCIKEIPKLNDLFINYKSKGVTIFGLNIIDQNFQSVNDICVKNKMQYPNYFGNKDFMEKFNISQFPTYILIDNSGQTKKIYKFNEVNELQIKLDDLINL